MKKRNLYLLILTFITSINSAFAQVIDGDPVPCPGGPDDEGWTEYGCYLPLDNWVYALVIAAVIFGAYKLYKKQKALNLQ